jgi:putative hydrolase of the HAD superfamily
MELQTSNPEPKVVTFDCAETLVAVNWEVGGFVCDCLASLGVEVGTAEGDLYRRMYYERLPEFLQVNLTRDPAVGAAFWRRLGADWLDRIGQSPEILDDLVAKADVLGFGESSILFRVYDDVVPCLERLRDRGMRMAVVSNWDYSLHRVVRMFGLEKYLDLTVASLEEGVEKPDPRLFEIALARLGCPHNQALHVGDNPVDDYEGALAAGMSAILIDRSGRTEGAITTLDDLEEAVGWTG